MKNILTKLRSAAALAVVAATFNFQPSTARAQGSLTPPGAPAPTMKTLAQVEPRTAITNTGSAVTISQPGSYYLTTNLTVSSGDAITITANNVRLDLNGFAISSTATPPAGTAVSLSGSRTNIAVVNGLIFGGVTNNGATAYGGIGLASGIYAGGTAYNVRVADIQIYGCSLHGINLGTGTPTLVKNCRVTDVGWEGIVANLVLDCYVNAGGGGNYPAIQGGTVCNSDGFSYAGPGVQATHIADHCQGFSSTGYGVSAPVVSNCRGQSTNQTGITATIVHNSSGSSANASGIYTALGGNSIGTSSAAGSYAFYTVYVATGCAGYGTLGIYSSYSLISCVGSTVSSSYKYNMP